MDDGDGPSPALLLVLTLLLAGTVILAMVIL